MSNKYLITNASLVNEGKIIKANVFIENNFISKIFQTDDKTVFETIPQDAITIDAEGKYLLPGIIDTHVHFREPGLTHKADMTTESKAAIAGGVTTVFEMPNTIPAITSLQLIETKNRLASRYSYCNYSFYLGATNNNTQEITKLEKHDICGIKLFLGSSTGNMLVDSSEALEKLFSESKALIAVHSEDEEIIKRNTEHYKEQFGENIPIRYHSLIRSNDACCKSTELAVRLAKKYGTRLHLLHLSTGSELVLLEKNNFVKEKQITAEVCIPHLWFTDMDYDKYGTLIKCNPSVKTQNDKEALFQAILDDRIDIISTDHAPHTLEEKTNNYFKAPSGIPFVQHSLPIILEFYHQGKIKLEKIVEKMCHNPALCFKINKRGFIRKGYHADLILVDLKSSWTVDKSNILYKCKWSPLEGYTFKSAITHTFVNGKLAYHNGNVNESIKGEKIEFSE